MYNCWPIKLQLLVATTRLKGDKKSLSVGRWQRTVTAAASRHHLGDRRAASWRVPTIAITTYVSKASRNLLTAIRWRTKTFSRCQETTCRAAPSTSANASASSSPGDACTGGAGWWVAPVPCRRRASRQASRTVGAADEVETWMRTDCRRTVLHRSILQPRRAFVTEFEVPLQNLTPARRLQRQSRRRCLAPQHGDDVLRPSPAKAAQTCRWPGERAVDVLGEIRGKFFRLTTRLLLKSQTSIIWQLSCDDRTSDRLNSLTS